MLVKAADWIVEEYQKLQVWAAERFEDDARRAEIAQTVVSIVCIVAVATAVLVAAWLLIAVLGALTVGVVQAAFTGLGWALGHVADWHLTEVVTTPVHAYITAHAAGLPAAAEAIWSAWTLVGPGLWLICWLARSWGARLAWVLYGAGTVAMVYSASPASGRLLAAGVAVAYWAVLSVLAFRGAGRRPVVQVSAPASVPASETTALLQLREQVSERLAELRVRLERVELAARRSGPSDD
ncbi:hypothetical protein [Streptosporangium sandarakinum]|uniref:hypothetical protein n=1 Tax=Streptosporangium sandarakinum TaxID=1260955 RepID=UPI0036CC660E